MEGPLVGGAAEGPLVVGGSCWTMEPEGGAPLVRGSLLAAASRIVAPRIGLCIGVVAVVTGGARKLASWTEQKRISAIMDLLPKTSICKEYFATAQSMQDRHVGRSRVESSSDETDDPDVLRSLMLC